MSSTLSASAEENVVKNRLLFDGDGNGDDRRLNMLLKLTTKWGHATNPNGDPEEDIKTHAKLRAQLLQCQWTDEKTKQVQKMNEREADTYEQLFERIRSEIEQAEKEIFETKIELEQARKIRRNRMEYDAMAKQINVYPTRAITGKKKQETHAELNRLKEEEEMLEDKLQSRKKQFHVLVNSIHRLQDLLEQEEEVTDAMVSSLNSANMAKEEGLIESVDEDGEDNDGDTPKDELNTSNVSSSPEDTHMEVS